MLILWIEPATHHKTKSKNISSDTEVESEDGGEKSKDEKGNANIEIESNVCKSDMSQKDEINIHPLDSTIHLSVHQKLLPPGKIIHIVRQYQRDRT